MGSKYIIKGKVIIIISLFLNVYKKKKGLDFKFDPELKIFN